MIRNVFYNWIERYFGDEEAVLLTLIILSSVVLLWFLGEILAPFLAAVVLAYLLQGIVNVLTRRSVPHLVAVLISYFLFIGMLLGIGLYIVPLVIAQAGALLTDIPDILTSLKASMTGVAESRPDIITKELLDQIFSQLNNRVITQGEKLVSASFSRAGSLMMWLVYLLLTVIMVFFLLKDWRRFVGGTRSFLPTRRGAMFKIWAEMDLQLANYLRGKAIEIVIVAVVCFAVFSIFGLRYALVLSLIVGLSVLIPFVGAFSVTIPVALVAFFQWGLSPQFFYLLLAYVVIQILDGNLLVPLIFSEVVNLNPITIILAVMVFGGLWGFWGIFFAIPLATLVKAIISAWPMKVLPNSEQSTQVEQ